MGILEELFCSIEAHKFIFDGKGKLSPISHSVMLLEAHKFIFDGKGKLSPISHSVMLLNLKKVKHLM